MSDDLSAGAPEARWYAMEEDLKAKDARIAELVAALGKINDIRNSIIGRQAPHWSLHIYPMVKILDESGFLGMSYPDARMAAQKQIEEWKDSDKLRQRAEAAEARVKGLEDDGN